MAAESVSAGGLATIGPVIALVAISVASHVGMAKLTDALVYNKPDYQERKRKADSLEAEVTRLKAQQEAAKANPSKAKSLGYSIKASEEALAGAKQAVQGLGLRAAFLQIVIQLSLFALLSSVFDGMALIRLPFVPFSFLTAITHRGVPGTDMTQAGWVFVFVLLNMCLKPILDAIMPPKNAPAAGGGFMEMLTKARDISDRLTGEDAAAAPAAGAKGGKKN